MTIKQKQHLLGYLGFYAGSPDGIWGRLSREATRAFQAGYGLEPDGIFGPATEKRILEVIGSGEQPSQQAQAAPDTGGGEEWWREIRYFTRAEFRCPCGVCGGFPAEPAEKLVRLADQVREHFGAPALPSSGVRCPEHNKEVGGVWNSRHLAGKALDFRIDGKSAAQVLAFVKTLPVHYAYAIDGSYVHMDVT